MARLRKPSAAEPPIFIPPTTTQLARSSPRKPIRESPSRRELRYTSSQDSESSFLVPKAPCTESPVRKQRVLRPVASNSRLLRKLSDESLAATPDKKERRVRREGSHFSYMYSKSLAKSVAKKQKSKGSEVGIWTEMDQETVIDETEVEKSILCGDKEGVNAEDKENVRGNEENEEEEEDEPVITIKNRRRLQQARRVLSDSDEEDEEDDGSTKETSLKAHAQKPHANSATDMLPPLVSTRLPFRKGHSTISNWAAEVIDFTSSPEPPASFILPPPARVRTASFAGSARPASSASCDMGAILQYSPTPTKLRSPRKAPPVSRPCTPSPPSSPSKLISPSKKASRIPHAPELRPSIDAFWNPEVVNEWNDKHSPSKPLFSPRKQKLFEQLEKQVKAISLSDSDSDTSYQSPTTSPSKKKIKSPTKKGSSGFSSPSVAEVRAQRKDFAARKHAIAEAFLTELDNTITNGRIASLSQATGGIKLVWSKTLKTTAGRANWRREQLRLRTGLTPSDFRTEIRHHCSIELAEKVIDDEERLYNVLAHEYCHLTTFMISEVRNNPHGAEFKSWGARVTRAFTHKGVEVTTKHSYKIEYKYVWECVACGYEFKRHSKSVDPERHSCGRCKGRLAQTKPTPRGAGKGDEKTRKSGYQAFVKEHFAKVKKGMQERGEDAQMGKVMEAVAKQYRIAKEAKTGAETKAKRLEAEVEVDEVGVALDGLKL